jgi:hypothetical protein
VSFASLRTSRRTGDRKFEDLLLGFASLASAAALVFVQLADLLAAVPFGLEWIFVLQVAAIFARARHVAAVRPARVGYKASRREQQQQEQGALHSINIRASSAGGAAI